MHDQWQVQIQARIQARADVHVHSDGLTDEQIREALHGLRQFLFSANKSEVRRREDDSQRQD